MQNAAAISTVSWISRSVAPSARACGDQLGGDSRPPDLHRAGDAQQRPQLGRDRGAVQVGAHLVDQGHALVELGGGERRVRVQQKLQSLRAGDVGGDQLALAAGQRVAAAQQHLGQLVQRLGRLRPEPHRSGDAGELLSRRTPDRCAPWCPPFSSWVAARAGDTTVHRTTSCPRGPAASPRSHDPIRSTARISSFVLFPVEAASAHPRPHQARFKPSQLTDLPEQRRRLASVPSDSVVVTTTARLATASPTPYTCRR